MGSFRRFHALEQAVDAVAHLDRRRSSWSATDRSDRGSSAWLTSAACTSSAPGRWRSASCPTYLRAMDAALVLAPEGAPFHYSPLKLAEYLAAAVPVVAPAVDQLSELLSDGVDAMLVPPNDAEALTAALYRLQHDPTRRVRIGHAGQQLARSGWTWGHQVRRLLDALPH